MPWLCRRYPTSTLLHTPPPSSVAGVCSSRNHRCPLPMDTARTSLVAHLISPMRAITTTPVGFMRIIRLTPHKLRPSPLLWRVGTYNDISRPAQCSLALWPAWPTDLPERPFLGVLQLIRYLLRRSKCFRLKRKIAGSDLHRRIKCTLARHTQ